MSETTVTLYTQPGCMPCKATARTLERRGVTFDTVDVSQDPAALEAMRSSGWTSTPVVQVRQDGDVVAEWTGLRVNHLAALADPDADLAALDTRSTTPGDTPAGPAE